MINSTMPLFESSTGNMNQDENDDRPSKQARIHLNPTGILPIDQRIAEKLDRLRINNKPRSKFVPNKPRSRDEPENQPRPSIVDRLNQKYDTLVPELDRSRPCVKLVKIISTNESLQLGEAQAKKQMELQVKTGLIGGIQHHGSVPRKFKFNDGYEMPSRSFPQESTESSDTHEPEFDTSLDTAGDSMMTCAEPSMSEIMASRRAKMAMRVDEANRKHAENYDKKPNIRSIKKEPIEEKSVRFVEPSIDFHMDTDECRNDSDNKIFDIGDEVFYKFLHPDVDSDDDVSDTDDRLD